ncbi:MAG TPA: hypothetical protein VFX59_05165 [Polyangiales bacterium]|nr:hypothetical protein [Polyangiales bacterium]
MSQRTDFLAMEHDPRDPSPWLALYLDQSVPMESNAKRAWLEDVSSRNRQFILPLTRPFARSLIAAFQLLKTVTPHVASSGLLHQLLAWNMKTFMTPQANLLVMRHFHLGSEILRFIADNSGVEVATKPLKPVYLDDVKDDLFLQHDLNLFNFVIELNRKLLAAGKELGKPEQIDFSAISDQPPAFAPFPDRLTNFVDLESAIELYTPLYQLFLTDHDFWRSSNSLQLDETIALYVARILGTSTHVALANNKHPMVPLTTLRAGYRLVLHGLSTELLHALLVKAKRAA